VLEFDTLTGSVTRTFDLTGTLQGSDSRGLEALTFVPDAGHPEGGMFYAGLQDDGKIYLFDLPIATSATSTDVQHISTITPVSARDDISGLHWDESQQTLFAIFDSDDALRAMLDDGTLIDEWTLPGDGQEGVAFTPCNLFVAHDAASEVWRYRFPTDTFDQDSDGLLDCLDNCPLVANVAQLDDDDDWAGDVCDCAVNDASASAPPVTITNLKLIHGGALTDLTWGGNGTTHDLVWGQLLDLTVDGDAGAAVCLEDELLGTAALDNGPAPGLGAGYYYLVRGENVCGTGAYAPAGDGAPRIPGFDCP